MATRKLNFSEVEYLSFEGGGGRGIVYAGVVKALQELVKHYTVPLNSDVPRGVLIQSNKKIFPLGLPIENKQIKGLSGSSAGAMTAFMLAIGMDYDSITKEMNRIENINIGMSSVEVSPFEKFFDSANNTTIRAFNKTRTVQHVNLRRLLDPIRALFTIIKSHAVFQGLRILVKDKILLRKLLFSEVNPLGADNLSSYVHSVFSNRGLFTGIALREYLSQLMRNHLYKKAYDLGIIDKLIKKGFPYKNSDNITFKDFFNLTGVDLVLTGTNVTHQRPAFFSVYCTPDFSVIDAVCLSMSLPIVFKPFFIEEDVHTGKPKEYNDLYRGLWIDGGLINNYPIHAFDKLETLELNYHGELGNYLIARPSFDTSPFNEKIFGFRLQGKLEKPNFKREALFQKNDFLVLWDYITTDLYSTILFPSEEGQIRSPQEREKTINIDCGGISIVDFASPELDRRRSVMPSQGELSKLELIDNAYENVKARFV